MQDLELFYQDYLDMVEAGLHPDTAMAELEATLHPVTLARLKARLHETQGEEKPPTGQS